MPQSANNIHYRSSLFLVGHETDAYYLAPPAGGCHVQIPNDLQRIHVARARHIRRPTLAQPPRHHRSHYTLPTVTQASPHNADNHAQDMSAPYEHPCTGGRDGHIKSPNAPRETLDSQGYTQHVMLLRNLYMYISTVRLFRPGHENQKAAPPGAKSPNRLGIRLKKKRLARSRQSAHKRYNQKATTHKRQLLLPSSFRTHGTPGFPPIQRHKTPKSPQKHPTNHQEARSRPFALSYVASKNNTVRKPTTNKHSLAINREEEEPKASTAAVVILYHHREKK